MQKKCTLVRLRRAQHAKSVQGTQKKGADRERLENGFHGVIGNVVDVRENPELSLGPMRHEASGELVRRR